MDVKAETIWLSPEVGSTGEPFGGDDGAGGYAPLAVVAGGSLYWVHGNHLGVPVVTTTASGTAASPSGFTRTGFPGQTQTLADLYYNRYRDYDPTTGRYIQADPIGLNGGNNLYQYAAGNPVNVTDPLGLNPAALPLVGLCAGPQAIFCVGGAIIIGCLLIPACVKAITPQGGVLPSLSPSVPRPRDMTPLEERQFDRYCRNSSDPCAALKIEIAKAIDMAEIKMQAMLADKGKMFGNSGWVTHGADLAGKIGTIYAMISVGEKLGCNMNDERAKVAKIMLPTRPL